MSPALNSQRGQIGQSWLASSVREKLEQALGPGGRTRGKQVARAGGVHWVEASLGRFDGQVGRAFDQPGVPDTQHERTETREQAVHHPLLTIGPWRDGDVEAFSRVSGAHPNLLLHVMEGTYGPDSEAMCERYGVGLLPGATAYPSFDCTCGAFPAVCAHIYALVYMFVEHIDEHPGDYLRVLGIDVNEIPAEPPAEHTDETQRAGEHTDVMHTPRVRSFDPHAVRPDTLHAVMSDDAACVIAQFYASAPAVSQWVRHIDDSATQEEP